MSVEPETTWTTRKLVIRVLYTLPYLFLAYILSAGPMYWEIYDAFQPHGSVVIRRLYYPIVLACEHSDYISNFFHWYAMLWAFQD
ncbi:MAG: hypothetical protein Tsb009_14360 [Planctomycetaceae bacterium]